MKLNQFNFHKNSRIECSSNNQITVRLKNTYSSYKSSVRRIRTSIFALFVICLFGCQDQDHKGVWMYEGNLNRPIVIMITENLFFEDISGNYFAKIFQYKIQEDQLVLKIISETYSGQEYIDTFDFSINDDKLTIDSFTYYRINQDKNYYQELLNKKYGNLSLPEFDYKNTSQRNADNYLVVPEQHGDSLNYIFNGHKIKNNNFNEVCQHIVNEERYYNNRVRFLIDKNVKYGQINRIRNNLRAIYILNHDFIYCPAKDDKFNYFDTYNLFIRGRPMSEPESEEFNEQMDSTFILPPPPIFDRHTKDDIVEFKLLERDLIKFENDSMRLNEFGKKHIKKIMGKNKVLVLRIPDTTNYTTYLEINLRIHDAKTQIRDSLSIKKYNYPFNEDLNPEEKDSIMMLTGFDILELNQILKKERQTIIEKYGLNQ